MENGTRDELAEFIARLGGGDNGFRTNEPTFVFFSEDRYREDCAAAHRGLRDVETDYYINSEGESVPGNYLGGLIDGYPGSIVDGVVVRPPNYKGYKLVGEQIAAGQTPAKGQVVFDVSSYRPGTRWQDTLDAYEAWDRRSRPDLAKGGIYRTYVYRPGTSELG